MGHGSGVFPVISPGCGSGLGMLVSGLLHLDRGTSLRFMSHLS